MTHFQSPPPFFSQTIPWGGKTQCLLIPKIAINEVVEVVTPQGLKPCLLYHNYSGLDGHHQDAKVVAVWKLKLGNHLQSDQKKCFKDTLEHNLKQRNINAETHQKQITLASSGQ